MVAGTVPGVGAQTEGHQVGVGHQGEVAGEGEELVVVQAEDLQGAEVGEGARLNPTEED